MDDSDSTRVKQDAKLVEGMGEIIVSVFRTAQREQLQPYIPQNRNRYDPVSEVAEKALKGRAISHGVA